MDFKDAFVDGSIIFLLVFAIGLIVLFVEKHNKDKYDWKELGKWVFYALSLGVARFIGSLVFHV